MTDAVPAAPLLAQLAAGTNGALTTFLLYTVLVFSLAWFSHRVLSRKKFLSEYFLGSRGLGVIAFTLTFGATSASAGSFGGFPAKIYAHGWILALWIASYMVVPLCAMGLLGKRLNQIARATGAITLPEVLRERFQSRALGIVSTLVIVFLLSFYLVPQFKISSEILAQLLQGSEWLQAAAQKFDALERSGLVPQGVGIDGEYLVCLFLFAVMVIFYTSFGGFRAVVWTDVLQGFVMVFGVMLMLYLAISQVGGLGTATREMADMTPPNLGTARFVSEKPAPARGIHIPTDRWFTLPGESPGRPRLFRLNESVSIAAGQTDSHTADRGAKIVEITTPGQIDEILERAGKSGIPPLHENPRVEPRDVNVKPYTYGAGQQNVYVGGPGPSEGAGDFAGFMTVGFAIGFFVFWALSGTGQPGNMVRLMAFNSARTLKRSIALLSVYFSLIYFPLVVIFCCARVLEPGLEQEPDRIMPKMAFSLTAGAGVPWLAGLLVAAPFAAAMSTVDSFMLMVSSAVTRDVYQRNINPQASEKTIKRLSYACVVIVGVVATLGAIYPPKYLQDLIIFAGGGLAAAFLVPVAMALYWPRANTPGMLAAMLGGLAIYLAPLVAGLIYHRFAKVEAVDLGIHPIMLGIGGSIVCGLLATLLTARPPEGLVRRFF